MKKNYYYSFVLLAMLGMASPQSAFADNEGIHAAKTVQQAKKVTGKVMTATGEPVIGAAVLVKGTTNGTVTDLDGNFQINAEVGNILEISYIGYETFLVKVGAGNNYNVTLQEDAETLDEVVVTAMGIKKERKALGYAVSDLKSEELMKNKNTNVVNSLAGKVPGVNITQSSGAAGAGASITIRGGNSTSEGRENQPLFVVDGIIYDNSTQVTGNSGYGGETRSSTTYSNRVMDINPEDIENMSVLKGAAAAALYGSRAADGVIIITTKKGAEGSVKVDVNSKLSTSFAGKTPEAQTVFGRGSYSTNGVLSETTYSQWGEKIAAGTPIYNNIDGFFQNGIILDNSVSISGGHKNGSFFLSASNFDQQGIVRETGYNKSTVRFNGEQKYGKLTVAANMSYSIAKTDKTLTSGGLYSGGGNGTMTALYGWPVTDDMTHYLNEDGSKYRILDGIVDLASETENPYWIINKNKLNDQTKRFTGAANANFKITDWWDVTARVGYDQYTTDAYTYIAPGGNVSELYQNGRLNKNKYSYEYITTNVMTNLNKKFGDFDFNLLLGTTTESTTRLSQNHWGYNFITPGTISFNNIAKENQFFKDATSKKRMVGVYGEFRASYKSLAYLTVTGRNDWSSTLPVENRSYFYPSVSGSFVVTELFEEKSDILSYAKVRGSWAKVGKDANPYATLTYLVNPLTYIGGYTGVGNSYTKGNAYLLPEIQKAWEVGLEMRFFNNRLGFDWTYYKSETENQIASPRLSNANGSILSSINSGSVINEGMELAINATPVQKKNFSWDVTLNMSYNRGTLGELLKGVEMFYPTDAQFGTVKSASVPNGGKFLALVGNRYAYETQKVGDTVEEIKGGRYEIDPKTGLYKVHSSSAEIVGNREPKFIGGLNNTINWKNLTVSALLDIRIGGDVYNGTKYYMTSRGMDKQTLLNDRQSVTLNGVINKGTAADPQWEETTITYNADQEYEISGVKYSGKAMIQNYWSNYCSNSYNFIQSVNWLKLRSVSVSYDFTSLIKKQSLIKRLSVNATATNLFTWTNYDGMDPEVSTAGGTGGSGSTGIDYCSIPSTSSFTFGVNLTF